MSEFDAIAAKYQLSEPEGGWDAHDERVAAAYAADSGLELPDRLESLGVPRRLHSTILGAYSVTRSVAAMREFYTSDKTIAVLAGSPGCGKTVAAAAWLLHAKPKLPTKYLRPRKFVTTTDFCRISAFDRDEFEAVTRATLLVVDDVGAEYADKRAYFATLFADLLSKRHGDMLPTVITSNLPLAEIKSNYGNRVESRLNDALITQLRGEKDLRKVAT